MDSIQTLSNAVASAIAGNSIYSAHHDVWRYLLESFTGGEEYRNAGHLVRYQLENNNEYQARLKQTPLDNHCQAVVSVYNSFLFRNKAQRELGTLDGLAETQDFLRDADLDGRSLDNFMKDVATWASVFGHTWVMVVKPNVGATTRAEELALGVRPYISYLTPLVVLDWSWSRNVAGRYELSYFKYIEESNGSFKVIKEWTPQMIYTTEVDVEHDTVLKTYEEVNQLNKIPAVCVYNKKSITRGLGISDIADIADAQKFIYNCTSEILQSVQMDTHPSLVATPETNVGTGSGALIHMPDNLDPALKPYLLEFSGAGVDKILSAISHKEDAIDKMANIGSIRGTEAKRMSGVAQQQEFELLNARLAEKANNLEHAEEQIWRLVCEYSNISYTATIKYPGSFNIRDTSDEIAQLKIAAEAVGDDPTAKTAIVDKVFEWMGVEKPDTRQYSNGEPIDPRLPDAYRDATGQAQQCENCAFYNPETFACGAFEGAAVRPMWVCAQWSQ